MDDVFIYTIGDEKYFLGLVALINSLALIGHRYPLIIGDCGLSQSQKSILQRSDRVRIFPLDRSLVCNPQQFKAFAHLAHKGGVAVIIDSDMIVVDSLEPLIDKARRGKFCTFANPEADRWFAEWQDIFELKRPVRKQTYFCTGFQVFSTEHFPTLLAEWWEACRLIWSYPTCQEGANLSRSPTSQSDQDALNAIMMSGYPESAVYWAPADGQVHRPFLREVKIRDIRTLRCEFRGRQPSILHASMLPKPWMRSGTARDAYDKLLRRLLTRSDVFLKLPPSMVDPFLKPGPHEWWDRHRTYVTNMGVGPLILSYMPRRIARPVRRTRVKIRSLLQDRSSYAQSE